MPKINFNSFKSMALNIATLFFLVTILSFGISAYFSEKIDFDLNKTKLINTTKLCGKNIDTFQLNTHWENDTRLQITAQSSCGGNLGDAEELNQVHILITKRGSESPLWEIVAPSAVYSDSEKLIAVGSKALISGSAIKNHRKKLSEGITMDWSQKIVRSPLGLMQKF
jgi:hypothetical protein